MATAIVLFALTGAVSGFLAGLLGIGGGIVLVPAFVWLFSYLEFDQVTVFQQALATSMAVILFTALSSVRAHHRRGSVDWTLAWRFAPGVLTGTLLGAFIATRLSFTLLSLLFGVFLLLVAAQMVGGKVGTAAKPLPGPTGQGFVAVAIGFLSAMVAIGGGTMTVPYLAHHGVDVRRAVGTSAAVGLPIALGGTFGYVATGLAQSSLPAASLGYVYLPAMLGTAVTAMLMAPVGAWAAHTLPVRQLKMAFAVLLVIVAVRLLSAG